jgi:hypothetical protein
VPAPTWPHGGAVRLRWLPAGRWPHHREDRAHISIGPYEAELTRARATQKDPAWRAEYRAIRPKVELKLGHLMRRRPVRDGPKSADRPRSPPDFSLLAASVNLMTRFARARTHPGSRARVDSAAQLDPPGNPLGPVAQPRWPTQPRSTAHNSPKTHCQQQDRHGSRPLSTVRLIASHNRALPGLRPGS